MSRQFSKPKGFGEILDHTFQLSKSHFGNFIKIFLLLIGPIYVLQAFVQLATGVSFFREVGSGEIWIEQILSGFVETGEEPVNLFADIWTVLLGLISLFLLPVAHAAILIAINHIRKDEGYTVSFVIKQAFSRYWPIVGSSIIFGLIVLGFVIAGIIAIGILGAILVAIGGFFGVLLIILLFVGGALGCGLLLTRWSFYFGSVVFNEEFPGFSRSWQLTKNRMWTIFGLFVVFFLIISFITSAVEFSLAIFLGNSVLFVTIINIVTMFTSMVFSVGYAVMYFDSRVRHDADDLKELIEDYKE